MYIQTDVVAIDTLNHLGGHFHRGKIGHHFHLHWVCKRGGFLKNLGVSQGLLISCISCKFFNTGGQISSHCHNRGNTRVRSTVRFKDRIRVAQLSW